MKRNNLPSEWVAIARKHRNAVPAGSGFAAYKVAMRKASAEYHGGRPVESNPAGHIDLVKLGIIGAAVWFGFQAWRKGQ